MSGQGMGRCEGPPQTKENCPHMARLSGVDLPRDKRVEVALTYIYGIGRTRALQTLDATGVSGDTRVSNLTDEELIQLRDWIDASYQVEGDLRREVAGRHPAQGRDRLLPGHPPPPRAPVHGQRTQTNARTRKGKKKTVAGKKKAGKK